MAVSAHTRFLLHERAYGCCEMCGRPGATNAHHRVNQSQGGPDTLSNLMLLCGSGTTGCHGVITMNPEWAASMGYTVRSHTIAKGDPSTMSEVPVLRWSREEGRFVYVLLDDDGGITPAMFNTHIPLAGVDFVKPWKVMDQ